MLDHKLLEKFFHFSTAKEVENNMDLNEAAEFLDQLDDVIKEKIFVKDKEEKQSQSQGGFQWIMTKTQPVYKYGLASVFAILIAVLIINKEPQPTFSLPKGFNSVQLSDQAITLLKKEHKQSSENLPLQKTINRVLNRIMNVAEMKDQAISAHVISTGVPGAWVLAENKIIISSEMVSLCSSEDELAVILSHELAHIKAGHVNNPFMDENLNSQYREYLDQLGKPISDHLIKEYSKLFHQNEERVENEIQADKEGISLTVLAGYDPNSVYSIFNKALSSQSLSQNYPSKDYRLKIMEERFGEMVDDAELFYAGLLFYLKGDLNQSEQFFNAYQYKFPGREVYNNLGLIQYHRGLYRMPISSVKGIRPIGMDFLTLADKIVLRGKSLNDHTEYFLRAKKEFEKAISVNPNYALAHFNLANVYLDLDDIPNAQKHLSQAEILGFSDQKCNLVRSSIFIQQKKFNEAKSLLRSLPNTPEVLFNRGVIAINTGRESEGFFTQFIQKSRNIHPVYQEFAQNRVKKLPEIHPAEILPECSALQGMTIGITKTKMTKELGKPQKTLNLISDISLWIYPEKSLKIYFERDKVVYFVHTNPLDCQDDIFNSYLDKSQLYLNPELRNYYSFDNGIIAGSGEQGLSLYGKFDN
ncbi:MAG: M48 family metalloprotease [Candidatus Marinimicrobia bacterium]|nr:M48 family metalloprotease [Candidatus Neomarinimicrobiota bacterium]